MTEAPSGVIAIDRDAAERLVAEPDIATAGAPLWRAKAVAIVLHGRGGTAAGILDLGAALAQPDVAFLAPQAPGDTWYPHSFIAPRAANEPSLSRSLERVESLVSAVLAAGVPARKLALMGFSQGACLACETAVRAPRRYGAVVAFTGGIIGPEGEERTEMGDFGGAPVFLGTSDVDPHVPLWRVRETAALMSDLGAEVDARVYPNAPHAINDDELAAARGLLVAMQEAADPSA